MIVIEINPEDAEAWNNKGFALANLKNYDEAIKCYDKAIEINPESAYAWNNKGVELANLKNYDEAIKCYDKSIEINPEYAKAWFNKGDALYDLKNYDEAIKCLEKAIDIDPEYAYAWLGKGIILKDIGRYDEALKCLDKCLELYPQNTRGLNAVAMEFRKECLSSMNKSKEITEEKDDNGIKTNDSALNNKEYYYKKGVIFEQYVIDLFDPSFFCLYDCTRDNSKHFNRKVESDQNPDITMRYKRTNKLFSIECKFRSSAVDEKVSWARDDQIKNYLSYRIKNNRPVFVVIGLGGKADKPNRMFCIPIEDAIHTDLYLSLLSKYERKPSKKFFWNDGNLS